MQQNNYLHITQSLQKGAKILFASFPADGHFNPMTGLAVHLKNEGYDVRWYTSPLYQPKIEKLGIPFFPFQKAADINGDNVSEMLPERNKFKSQVRKLNFDLVNVFILRGPEYFEDLKTIYQEFPFELVVADIAFMGVPFVTDLMKIPVLGIGIAPISKNSKDLPPSGLGMTPSYSFFGRAKQGLLRFMANHLLLARCNKTMVRVLKEHGIDCITNSLFDLPAEKCNLILQSGTPGFEYRRSDFDPKYKFAGPLLPFTTKKSTGSWHHEKLAAYKKIVLVTQGTVEKDETKLLVPTLEALQNTEYLVVVTTGGTHTDKLRAQYPAPNVIIEDFIPFGDIMPYADVYITNGGYGGVMLSIMNGLPMVTAGIHEGKNEICARVGYFNLGINLNKERPTAAQIRSSVDQVTNNDTYLKNVMSLSKEFSGFEPAKLCEKYASQLLARSRAGRVLNKREKISE